MVPWQKVLIRVCLFIYLLLYVVASQSVSENGTSTTPTPYRETTAGRVTSSGTISSLQVRPGSSYQTSEFVNPYINGSFKHLVVSEKFQDVFIGAVDYLYSLDKDLNKKLEVKTGPELDSEKCPPPPSVDKLKNCTYPLKYMNSVNRVLLIDEVDDRLIVCGTLYHGYCERRNLTNISHMETPDMATSVVTNNASASVVAFIAPGPAPPGQDQQRVLYVSVSWSSHEGLLGDIPALASRKLKDFTLVSSDNAKFVFSYIKLEGTQRPQFPVRYVYGFSSEGFSYMLTVQRAGTENNNPYRSMAIRVCQNDLAYHSYVEVPLQCGFKTDTENVYNILVAAHVTKAGRNLALSLGINTRTDVLFALFAKMEKPSAEPKAEALCIFRMDTVRREFTETVKRCFEGKGVIGGGHLGIPKACSRNTFKINDDYCGEAESNYPIIGTVPIVSQPLVTFPAIASNLSSIRVTTTHDYTVAFVGSRDGKIIKISLESNTSANIYEILSVVPKRAVEADTSFDDDMNHLYVLTDKKVVKLKVQNCGQYTSCWECLEAKDPYCGWCSLENKCSQRSDCQGSDESKRWLPYNSQECPKIKKIIPDQIQKDKERLLTLDIQHIPDFEVAALYKCVFTSPSNPDSQNFSIVANRTRNNLQCYTPPKDDLPPFDSGKDSVIMKLSVLMNDQELVHENVTFFDCGIHKSCTACTKSQFPCTWCIMKHMCTENADQHCERDVFIAGMNKSGSSAIVGPEHCPRIEAMHAGTEILVASGSIKKIEVRAVALQDFQQVDLQCQFNKIDVVPATLNKRDQEFFITCGEYKFEYLWNVDSLNVPLKILWGGGDNCLDNPSEVLVVVYKCSSMAHTCGDCFITSPKYKCGWCNGNSCMTETFCMGGNFLQKGAICPNPEIHSFSPKSGHIQGGTLLTISGKNLGSSVNEVQVNISDIKCSVTSVSGPDRIYCKTEKSGSLMKSKVKVVVGPAAGNQFMNESVELFSFVEPQITEISPGKGPYAGGTLVTLKGEYLDAGSNISVFIGQNSCTNPYSISASAITCKTSAVTQSSQDLNVTVYIDDGVLQTGVVFRYVENPNVTWISRYAVIRRGGLQINVSGENLDSVESPRIIFWANGQSYEGPCEFTQCSNCSRLTNITCLTPEIDSLEKPFDGVKEVDFGFRMDGVHSLEQLNNLGRIKVYPDPKMEEEIVHQHIHGFLYLRGSNFNGVKSYDVRVSIGQEECSGAIVENSAITCKAPATQPAAAIGEGLPEVKVRFGQNLTYNLGFLSYGTPEELTPDDLSLEAIIGIVAGVAVFVIVTCIGCIIGLIKFRHNDDMMKKMRKEMDQLESRVANECKEAFAELQTDMNELTSNLSGGCSIPFWDYRTYCMRVLFPPENNDHPVIRELELDYRHKEDTERGLKLFFNLIRNKTFLLIFIRTLEANKDFSMKERVNVASLISVCLQTQMEYATEILKTLLAELIEKTIENPKVHPKILLRRNESVAEKMLTNWFTFLLYKFVKECAGEPLFMLYNAIKQQVSKGPVDAITSEARYSLSEDKLIRQHVNYKPMVLYFMDLDVDRYSQAYHPVKVLDCDTISQVKDKILDAVYKSAPFSNRPPKEELDLVLFDHLPEWMIGDKSQVPLKMFPSKDTKRLVLSDEDHTTKSEGDCKRLNTLSHYKVPDGAYVALHPKQTSIYNMSIMSEKSKFSNNSYYNRSPSLNRSLNPPNVHIDVEGCKVYHLVRHQDVESNNKEGDRGNKMVSEIYLPRLLVTKGTLQTFVDDLFERIFSTAHRGTVLPLAIKYMFDFLDDQALHHNMGDEVVHIWKSNSLPLRYWVNVIKNPNFAFDIYKSNIVDACLTVIGQTFMDSCSTLEHKLTKDSPSNKLLYAKDIPKYKQWVARYYQDIKIMPAISDQDMTAMLAEESRAHQNEFNTNAALLELYKYVRKHYEDIMNALEDDEFAKKNRLTSKLDQVAAAMDGTTIC